MQKNFCYVLVYFIPTLQVHNTKHTLVFSKIKDITAAEVIT